MLFFSKNAIIKITIRRTPENIPVVFDNLLASTYGFKIERKFVLMTIIYTEKAATFKNM